MTKILIVEDEQSFIDLISKGLKEEGFSTTAVTDGLAGLKSIKEDKEINLAIIDVMIPGLTGFKLVKEIRQFNKNIPLLMLTAKDDITSKVRGFESGCDDYLTKPFSFDELVLRINALLRRSGIKEVQQVQEIIHGDFKLDLQSHLVFKKDIEIKLTKTEFDIFSYLLERKDMVISRQQILENVRGYSFDTATNIVDVHIRSLRKKIDIDNSIIKTVRGVGYVIRSK